MLTKSKLLLKSGRIFSTLPAPTNNFKYPCHIDIRNLYKTSNMSKFKILIANDTIPSISKTIFEENQCEVVICKEDRNEIMKNISGIDGLYWASYIINLDADILEKAGPKLKAIATMSSGYNNIDIGELKKRGIKFGNTPGVVGDAVAEQAIMLALAASRRVNEGRLAIENEEWSEKNNPQWLLGMEMRGSTVGIVGLGCIGQAIIKKLKGFEAEQFLYTGPREKSEGKTLGATFVSLDSLVKNSDYIFSCVPLNKETENIFNYNLFSKMKKNAVFVNVGRGGSVNQEDLIRALKEHTIFAAGLDVTTPEPLPPNHELLKLPNCVLSPHLGTSTWKTMEKMAELTAQNVVNALKGEPMLTPVF